MRKKLNKVIQLKEEQKKILSEKIESFYYDVRGENIGIIEREQILDLFLEELAPVIYNKALDDTIKWYKQMADNIESDFYVLYKDLN